MKAAGQLSIQAPSAMLMKITDACKLLHVKGQHRVRNLIIAAWKNIKQNNYRAINSNTEQAQQAPDTDREDQEKEVETQAGTTATGEVSTTVVRTKTKGGRSERKKRDSLSDLSDDATDTDDLTLSNTAADAEMDELWLELQSQVMFDGDEQQQTEQTNNSISLHAATIVNGHQLWQIWQGHRASLPKKAAAAAGRWEAAQGQRTTEIVSAQSAIPPSGSVALSSSASAPVTPSSLKVSERSAFSLILPTNVLTSIDAADITPNSLSADDLSSISMKQRKAARRNRPLLSPSPSITVYPHHLNSLVQSLLSLPILEEIVLIVMMRLIVIY